MLKKNGSKDDYRNQIKSLPKETYDAKCARSNIQKKKTSLKK